MEKYRHALFALGILICLVGAGLMLDGAILGETTINISILERPDQIRDFVPK